MRSMSGSRSAGERNRRDKSPTAAIRCSVACASAWLSRRRRTMTLSSFLSTTEVPREPFGGEAGNLVQSPRLFEQVRGARHDQELLDRTAEPALRVLVQRNNRHVVPA